MSNVSKEAYLDEVRVQYRKLIQSLEDAAHEEYEESRKWADRVASTCPKYCTKKDIVKKIRRVQGKGSAEAFGGLFYSSARASIDIDTNDVLHCNGCGTEWKIPEVKWVGKWDVFQGLLHQFYFFIDRYEDGVRYDPKNLAEMRTKEEAVADWEERLAHYRDSKEGVWLRQFHPDTIRVAVGEAYFKHDFYDEIANWSDSKFKLFGFTIPEHSMGGSPSSSRFPWLGIFWWTIIAAAVFIYLRTI